MGMERELTIYLKHNIFKIVRKYFCHNRIIVTNFENILKLFYFCLQVCNIKLQQGLHSHLLSCKVQNSQHFYFSLTTLLLSVEPTKIGANPVVINDRYCLGVVVKNLELIKPTLS